MLSVILLLAVGAGAAETPPTQAALATPTVASPDGFEVGVDTIDSVTAKLGKRFTTMSNSDGTTTLIYMSSKAHVKGASFIPVVGLFAGGAKSHISTKTFVFNLRGVLQSFSSSDTNADCSVALSGANCR